MSRSYSTSPLKIMGLVYLLIISISIPPLAIVLVPYVIYKTVRIYRAVRFARNSRDYYYEETDLMSASKLWRSR